MENEEKLKQYEDLCMRQLMELERERRKYEDIAGEIAFLRAENATLKDECSEKEARIKELSDWAGVMQTEIDKKNAWKRNLGPLYPVAKKIKHIIKK